MGTVLAAKMHTSRELLAHVASQDHGRLDAYSNYDLAVLTPVIFPLTFALVAVLFAFHRLASHEASHPTCRLVAGAITAGEGLFAFFCWGSCVANYADMGYSGGLSACDFQGWYSGFYSFSQPIFIGTAAAVMLFVQRRKEFPPTEWVASALVLGTIFALVMSSLPLMGETDYRFPKDFCIFDVQNEAMDGIFLVVFVLASTALVAASIAARESTIWWMYPVLTVFFWWGFSTLAAVVLINWSGDLSDHDNVWGWMAVLMHTQQLGNPLLYVLLWLNKIHEAGDIASQDVPSDESKEDLDEEACKEAMPYNQDLKKQDLRH